MRTAVCLAFLVIGFSYLLPNDATKGIVFLIGAAVAFVVLRERAAGGNEVAHEEKDIGPEPSDPDFYLYASEVATSPR